MYGKPTHNVLCCSIFFSDAKSDCWKGSGRGFADVMDRTLTEVQGGAGLGELVTYYQVLYLHTEDNNSKTIHSSQYVTVQTLKI